MNKTKQPITITNSSLHAFMSCRQKYDYRYNKSIVPVKKPDSLLLGSAVHSGLEAWFKYNLEPHAEYCSYCEGISEQDEIKAKAMVLKYCEVYKNDSFEVKEIEFCFTVPIKSPVTKRSLKNMVFSGKVDGLIEKDGDLWILEHKTTDRADEKYWQSKEFDDQIYLYGIAIEQLFGRQVKGALYDVLVKPGIKMNHGETDEEFEARLAEAKRPSAIKRKEADTRESYYKKVYDALDEEHFIREWIEFDRELMERKKMNLIFAAKDIRDSEIYENTFSCPIFSGCEYCTLCKNKGDLTKCEDLYVLRAPHEELEVNDG